MSDAAAARASDPEKEAARIYRAHRHESEWIDAFSASLDRRRAGGSLRRTLQAWGMSQAEMARFLGVSRQAVGKWRRQGAPPARAEAVADLAAATDLLVRYIKRDRIPAVVRREIPALGGVSLMGLLARGDTRSVRLACRQMFAFEGIQA